MSLASLCLAGFRHVLVHLSRAASVLQTLAIVGVLYPWEKSLLFPYAVLQAWTCKHPATCNYSVRAMLALLQHVLFSLVLALQGLTLWLFFLLRGILAMNGEHLFRVA